MYFHPQPGDLLMDVRCKSWEELVALAWDREEWRKRVQVVREYMTPVKRWKKLVVSMRRKMMKAMSKHEGRRTVL